MRSLTASGGTCTSLRRRWSRMPLSGLGRHPREVEVFSAIRNVLPAIEPDPRHLAGANLDPRRIAFLVVERARVEAPADFAEATTNTPDQAEINVHVLQTMILRSS